jgi:hypothetical protein
VERRQETKRNDSKVKGKCQWQCNQRHCNLLSKNEHLEHSYTTEERGGSYLFSWIPEESSDEADDEEGAQEGTNLCAHTGPNYLDNANSFNIGSSEDDELDGAYSEEEDGDVVDDVLVSPPVHHNIGLLSRPKLARSTFQAERRERGKRRRDLQMQKWKDKVKEQQKKINDLRDELIASKCKCGTLENRIAQQSVDAAAEIEAAEGQRDQLDDQINESREGSILNHLCGYLPGIGKWKRVAFALFQLKVVRPFLIRESVTQIRQNLYTKLALAEGTDRIPGFSLQCVEDFRSIEHAKKGTQKMVWSTGTIKKVHRKVESNMLQIIPMTVIEEVHDTNLVDGVSFDVEALFIHVIKAFGLSEKAQSTNVEIAITIDGAKIEGQLCHATIGFKIVDVSAVDPNTGEKMYSNMQSDQWCIPIMTLIAKDSKSTYQKYFSDILDFTNRMRTEGLTLDDGTRWNKFHIPDPQDMKSHQLYLGRVGAAKGHGVVNFCQLCMCMTDNIPVPNQVPFHHCLKKNNEFCFHYDVNDRKLIQEAKEELLRLEADELAMKLKRMCEATVPRDVWDNNKMCPWDHM